jgi:hypothetical protein
MAIALGATVIDKIALGGEELFKVYRGAVSIHDKTGAPPDADVILLENGSDALLLETSHPVERDTTILAQSTAATLGGDEWTVVVQGGATRKVRAARIAEYLDG